ncbi:MAG: LysR family transcriptional regulator [Epsilonproteobacteria bacterium]|nr:LysR family transcriptional regulator [Campylobacterota bacterium]
MEITLRQIEIFLNVVTIGHLTKVAKKMNLSQSAVSMAIKELESILNKPLFDRLSKKLILNESGRSFYRAIEPLYRRMEDIENEFKNSKDKGIIRVGASTTIVDYLMPSIVCDFMAQYPEVKIELKEGNTKEISSMIKKGDLDIGFVEGVVEDSDIIKETIASDELVVVTSNEKLKNKTFYIDELANYKWVLREKGSGTREVFLNYIKDKVAHLNIFLELGHTESIKTLLLTKKPISALSILAVREEIERGELFKIELKNFKCTRDFFAIYHKEKYKSELFQNFFTFAKEKIKNALEFKKVCSN